MQSQDCAKILALQNSNWSIAQSVTVPSQNRSPEILETSELDVVSSCSMRPPAKVKPYDAA